MPVNFKTLVSCWVGRGKKSGDRHSSAPLAKERIAVDAVRGRGTDGTRWLTDALISSISPTIFRINAMK